MEAIGILELLSCQQLTATDTNKIITKNINLRSKCISKFYSWLELNGNTPNEIRLLILDTFGCLLYGIVT